MFWLPCMLREAALMAQTLQGIVQAKQVWPGRTGVCAIMPGGRQGTPALAHYLHIDLNTRLLVGHCGACVSVCIQAPMSRPLTLCAPDEQDVWLAKRRNERHQRSCEARALC